MTFIKTARLKLHPLDVDQLRQLQKGRLYLERSLGLKPSEMQISSTMLAEIEDAMHFWLQFTEEHPEAYAWGTNWEIILEQENISIGGIGLGGTPNKDGLVTVGYHIDPRKRRQGYASEALGGLRDWACAHPACLAMIAFTPIENTASQSVLTKCGFEKTGQVTEEGIACYSWRYDAPETS
ncbi:MAG: GNAT family N-acetyltransferase [Saprospiraceae bacterium]|nr:GNAT family N-acetyltransferase [Saprospiraceae bacterium]